LPRASPNAFWSRAHFPLSGSGGSTWIAAIGKEVASYGIWFFILGVSTTIIFLTDNLVVGYFIGTSAVAIYSIAAAWRNMRGRVVLAFNWVLTPVAATYDAKGDLARQQRLLIQGTRASLAYAIFMTAIFLTYGDAIIRSWVGPGFEKAAVVLALLTLPSAASITQMTTSSVLQGMAKHKSLALILLGRSAGQPGAEPPLGKAAWHLRASRLGTDFDHNDQRLGRPTHSGLSHHLDALGRYYTTAFCQLSWALCRVVPIVAVRYFWQPPVRGSDRFLPGGGPALLCRGVWFVLQQKCPVGSPLCFVATLVPTNRSLFHAKPW